MNDDTLKILSVALTLMQTLLVSYVFTLFATWMNIFVENERNNIMIDNAGSFLLLYLLFFGKKEVKTFDKYLKHLYSVLITGHPKICAVLYEYTRLLFHYEEYQIK